MILNLNRTVIFLLSGLISGTFINGKEYIQSNTVKSAWVYLNSAGKLTYKNTERGDRIMDFSHAGYMGGGVAIPEVPVRIKLSPSGGDDTKYIQDAVDKVSSLPLTGKFRGSVLLSSGTYYISSTINIYASGVVLRGESIDNNRKSTLVMRGTPFNAITMRLKSEQQEAYENAGSEIKTKIADKYVPSGSSEFTVANSEKFSPGDLIQIHKPVTPEWIEFMQMHNLVRDGKPQTWIKEGSNLITERFITEVCGDRIKLDVPLSDAFDARFSSSGIEVIKVNQVYQPKLLKQSGIENLRIISPLQPISHSQPHFTALRIYGEDCWAMNILIEETMNSVETRGKRITIQNVVVKRTALHQGSSRPAEFAPNAGQVLIDRCKVIADNVWFVATGSGQAGPIVILNCEFIGNQRAESHQRWSSGMLYDNVKVENGGIDFRNRGSMGSGHGWSMGWGVAWNCIAKEYVIQNPPGAYNWMIGCKGESKLMPRPFDKAPFLEEGIKDSPGIHVYPKSLYLAQLEERLGLQAIKNIGY